MCLCAFFKKYVLMCFCQKIYFMLMPKNLMWLWLKYGVMS